METKILKAVFGGGTSTVTNKRTRTDYGQVLEIIGIDLPDTFECIFSNSATSAGVGKKQIGSAQRVLIPDEYLATGQPIYAWILLHDTEDDGRHMYSIRIPVADMPDTSPEEPTPVEQSVISQAITALNSAVTTTTQKAQEATESADRAEQAAEGAEGYAERAESAQQAAESARDRATQAETSARTSAATASEKASEAISSATTASQSALTAETASESAQEYATASAESASQASQSADTASSKAQEASGYASSANASAQTASQKALEAAQSASTAVQSKTDAETAKQASETAQGLAESARDNAITAKTSAEDARDEAQEIVDGITGKVEQIDSNTDRIESLEDDRYKPYPTDTASGSIVSFSDGADNIPLKSCIVRVEPVQDLHGYDSPWPAGGGENILDPNIKFTAGTYYGGAVLSTADGYNITLSGTPTESGNISTNKIPTADAIIMPAGTYTSVGAIFSTYKADGSWYTNRQVGTWTADEPFVVRQAYIQAVAGASISGSRFIAMVKGTVAPTSWTPYSNICPITGWTGAKVQRTGVNLWDEEWEVGGISSVDGSKYNDRARIRSKNFISVKPSTQYYFAMPSTYISFKVVFYGLDKTFLSYTTYKNIAFTTPPNCYWLMLSENATDYGTTYNHDISINYPSADHDYHPYTGQTYPITFPSEAGTVYGGYIDPINGELVVDRAMVEYDGSNDERWGEYGADTDHYCCICFPVDKAAGYQKSICNEFKNVDNAFGSADYGTYSDHPNFINTYFRMPNAEVTTKAEFLAWIAENPIHLCYELATPIHYPITAIDIKTLLGQNNIWADTGDVSVEYRADVTLYINKKITEAVSALI